MKKIIFVLLIVAVFGSAQAAESSYSSAPISNAGPVITPNFAVGSIRTERYGYDTEDNLLVCPNDAELKRDKGTCLYFGGAIAWKGIAYSVRKTKTFVGFRFVDIGIGQGITKPVLEIYYK